MHNNMCLRTEDQTAPAVVASALVRLLSPARLTSHVSNESDDVRMFVCGCYVNLGGRSLAVVHQWYERSRQGYPVFFDLRPMLRFSACAMS